jgi:transposase
MSESQKAELKLQFQSAKDLRDRERLEVIYWATSGKHSLSQLAGMAGRARSTIQEWLEAYKTGGRKQLLERRVPPGKPSPLTEPSVQAQLLAGWLSGRWRTAGQAAAWLEETHGVHRSPKSMYYWLRKHGSLSDPVPGRVT